MARWTHRGVPCVALRNNLGNWCGYVAVPEGHPWHGRGYDDVPAEVHGGLTYAESGYGDDVRYAVPEDPAEEARWRLGAGRSWWWLGYDCGHAGDLTPYSAGLHPNYCGGDAYRDLDYVKRWTERLAEQAEQAQACLLVTLIGNGRR